MILALRHPVGMGLRAGDAQIELTRALGTRPIPGRGVGRAEVEALRRPAAVYRPSSGVGLHRRPLRASGLLVLAFLPTLLGCDSTEPLEEIRRRAGPPPTLRTCVASGWAQPQVREIVGGLETPWAIAPTPDGRLFVSERSGRIRLLDQDGSWADQYLRLPVAARGESGLLGIALGPGFAEGGDMYFAAVVLEDRRTEWFSRAIRSVLRRLGRSPDPEFELQLFRVRWSPDGPLDALPLLRGVPASLLHSGGALLFQGSDRLLLSVGDAMDPWAAQDPSSPLGSLLEITLPRNGNPAYPGRAATVVASGVRNPQGLVLMPDGRSVLFIDHGPSGLPVEEYRTGKDELNVFVAGANYGWPLEAGVPDRPVYEPPVVEWTPAIAPAGLAVIPHPSADLTRADVFIAGLRGVLVRVEMTFDDGTWLALCQETVLDRDYGRLRALAVHPEGGLVVGTSNTDGRGAPRGGDDRLLHVRPGTAP